MLEFKHLILHFLKNTFGNSPWRTQIHTYTRSHTLTSAHKTHKLSLTQQRTCIYWEYVFFYVGRKKKKIGEMVHLLHYQIPEFLVVRKLKSLQIFAAIDYYLYTPKLKFDFFLISHSLRVNISVLSRSCYCWIL